MLFAFALLSLLEGSSQSGNIPYKDALARDVMLPLAAAAYSTDTETCLGNLDSDYQLIRQVLVICDPINNSTCFGYVATSPSRNAAIVSFRGTVGSQQLEDEIWDVGQEPRIPFVGGGNVAQYFVDVFNLLWTSGIKEALTSTVRQYPNYQVWVTGHSLGAAIASLTALYAARTRVTASDNLLLLTFGQPRLGDSAFANAVDRIVPNAYRVVHARDVVPHGPPALFGFLHHMTEVFYENDMSVPEYMLCADGDEDKHCSNSYLFATSIENHRWYFGKQVPFFGNNNCISNERNTEFALTHNGSEEDLQRTNKLKALLALTETLGQRSQ